MNTNQDVHAMRSIAFPNIFNGSTVNLYTGFNAIKSNLQLLLGADRGALFGDPHFGTNLKQILYQQAYAPMIEELIKDEIYESIKSYMPQAYLDRDTIKIQVVDGVVIATIDVHSDSGIESNLFEITLLNEGE